MSARIGLCARVAARDDMLFDRMFSTVSLPDGREVIDRPMREKGRAICADCPLRMACLADALVSGWKDHNIIGGLTYSERCVLAGRVASGLGLEDVRRLHNLPAGRVKTWLDRQFNVSDLEADIREYWRTSRRSARLKKRYTNNPPEFRPIQPMPEGTAFQPSLFD